MNAAQKRVGQAYNTGVHDVGAAAQAVGHGVANIGTPAPVQIMAPQAQQAIQNARYGVLAHNPQAQQQFIQSAQVAPLSVARAVLPTFAQSGVNMGKGIGGATINTAQVPYSATRVVAANLTHNQPALQNAHKALTSDTANNMVWNNAFRQTSNELAGAIASRNYINKTTAANNQLGDTIATAYGNSPRAQLYGQLVAESGKNQDINHYLNDVGLNQNTSALSTGVRLGAPIVSAGAQTALQMTGAGAGAKAVTNQLAGKAAQLTAQQAGKQLLKTSAGYGLANGAVGVLDPLSQGDTNAMDYLKAGGTGALSGVAMSVLGAAAGRAGETALGRAVAAHTMPITGAAGSLMGADLTKLPGATKALMPALKSASKNAADTIKPAKQFIRDNRNITAQQKPLRRQIAATQAKIDALPLGDAKAQVAAENYQRRIDSLQGRDDALEASRPGVKQMLPNQKGYIRLPGGEQVDTPLYHGTTAGDAIRKEGFKKMPMSNGQFFGKGVYITSDAAKAKSFTTADGEVLPVHVPTDAKIYRANKSEILSIDANKIRKQGYDGLEIPMPDGKNSQITMFDPSKVSLKNDVATHSVAPDPKSTKREIAELDRKISAFGPDNSPAKQVLVDRRARRAAEIGQTEAPSPTIPEHLQPLAEEAKKYKSAEEFVTAQRDKPDVFSDEYNGAYSVKAAKDYIKHNTSKKIEVNSRTIDNQARFVDTDYSKTTDITKPGIAVEKDGQMLLIDGWHRFDKATKEGKKFEAHVVPSEATNLTDLYNQAHAQVPKKNLYDKLIDKLPNESGYAKIPGAKDFHEDLTPMQKKAVNEYANALEEMGSGQGVDFVKNADGYTRVSNNSPEYSRLYEQLGHKPTKYDWFDEAKRQLQAGKADEYMQADYNKLPSIIQEAKQPKPVTEAPVPAESRKNVGSSEGSVAQRLQDEARQHSSAEDFIAAVHKKIENPANGKSYTALAREYDLPQKDIATLDAVEKLRWSKDGPKTYPAAAEQLGLGSEYERITTQIGKEGDIRYKNPYGDTGILGDQFTSQELKKLYDKTPKPQNLEQIAQADAKGRPQGADQTAFEKAHNSGNIAEEAKVAATLKDPALRGEQLASSDRDAMLAKFRAQASKTAPGSSTTPALPRSRGAVSKPETPASKQRLPKSVDSQSQLKRSQLTGKALSTPSKEMTPAAYAKTFGISKEQATHELSRINDKPVKTRSLPVLKDKPASAAENTARNPVKVSIPEVKPGNYEQARINPQIASHPVNYAAGQVLDAAKGTGLDTSTFGRMVEGDLQPRNAREAAAVQAYKDLTNRVHATSQALGGNTPYVKNYFRHEWDLSNPEDAARFDKLATKSKSVDPYAFGGLDRQPRVFSSIAQGEAAGFKLKNPNLKDEVAAYGSGSAHALKQQALAKALTEADMGEADKTRTFDMGGGKNVLLSEKGMNEAKGYKLNDATNNKLVKGYRRGNRGFKQMLLSVSQFHPVNISLLRAAPTLASEFHPARAAKGVFDTFAAQTAPRYSAKLQTAAMRDGTLEASARLGTPIKFGSDYSSESKVAFGNGGLGEKAIFERAMPAMHIQMVKSAVADLKDAGLSLDSREAHALGTRINEIMGFVNTEARNLDRGTQRRLGDIFLAPQFTRSKWATNKAAFTQGGLAGSYARRAIVANAAAAAVVAMGVGYALHQKSDNTNDMLLRGIFHPSVPTPLKDKKGNTIELGLPATQSSEVLGLLGFSLKRKADGHLGVGWKGGNIPGNVANYGRSRLAVLPANVLKAATNTDYAGKPLYDPQANAKTKLEQGATTIGTGLLPIGGQGIVQTNVVKKHLPDGVQQVLNANTPGSNPLVKSIGSSFGLTPKTDKTVGKGLQTTQYFDAVNQATKGLNANDKAAYDSIHPQSKNPVSGTYQTTPTIYDSQQRATTYLKNPNVLAADNKLNQQLQKDGQTVDPFYQLNPDQQNIALNYSALAQGDTRRSSFQKAYPFLQQLSADRNSFFSSLPASTTTDSSGNSKAQLPANLQYPSLSADEQALVDKYYSATSPTTKKQLLNDPSIASAVGKVKAYSDAIASTRRVPKAEDIPGYTPPVPKNPVPSANTGNSVKTTYDPSSNTWTEVSSKTGRTTVISADGTRTVTNAGVRTSSGRRSTSTSGRKATIKSVRFSQAKLSSYKSKPVKVPKVSLSGTISGRMRPYKQPTLKLRKKAYS